MNSVKELRTINAALEEKVKELEEEAKRTKESIEFFKLEVKEVIDTMAMWLNP
jgi:hypothetical protein